MVVSGKRFMLLTTRKGAVSDLVEVYGNDSLEDFRQHIQRHYPAACDHAKELASEEDDTNPGYREIEAHYPDWWLLQVRPGALQPMSPTGTRQWAEASRPFWRLNADDDAELIAVAAGCQAQADEGILLDIATLTDAVAGFIEDLQHAASNR